MVYIIKNKICQLLTNLLHDVSLLLSFLTNNTGIEMPETLDISSNIKNHLDKLNQILIEQLQVPDFYIAGWPAQVGSVWVKLRKPGFLPEIKKISDRHFRLGRIFCTGFESLMFYIDRTGAIEIGTFYKVYWSRKYKYHSDPELERKATALLLFQHLKDRALPKIISKVERDTKKNAEAVAAVRKALEPFMPQIVADELTK